MDSGIWPLKILVLGEGSFGSSVKGTQKGPSSFEHRAEFACFVNWMAPLFPTPLFPTPLFLNWVASLFLFYYAPLERLHS